MKIVQVNTRDVRGGAAKAAYRLHQALQQAGEDCQMVVRWQTIVDDSVLGVTDQTLEMEADDPAWQTIQQRYLSRNLTGRARTLFNLPYPGFDLSSVAAIAQADIIHLHWVAQFLSPSSLKKLLDLGKPVVWTLHDMWPFTGGCHYASGCDGYTQSCAACPQLRDDPYGLPQAVLQDRLAALKGYDNLTIVTPSRWLAEVARSSAVLGDRRIEVIPNPIETEAYQPLAKNRMRKRLGIAPNAFTFVAQSSIESRKEFPKLISAIRMALNRPKLRAMADAGKLHFLFFGSQSEPLDAPDIPFTHVGWCNTRRKLIELYSAGDVFILPSLEDNLPNVMLESISCGTPLMAFDVGGMPDVIQPGKTGWLAPVGNFGELAKLIVECATNSEESRALQPLCRQEAEAHYSMEVIAQRFLGLYREVLQPSSSKASLGRSAGTATMAIAPSKAASTTLEASAVAPSLASFDATMGDHFAAIHEPVLMRSLLKDSQERLMLQRQLELTREALAQQSQTIEAMESSKFWKLRNRWFQLKRRLGLPADDD